MQAFRICSGRQFITGIPVLMLLCPLKATAAQPPLEPYVWHNVVIGGGGFVTGIIFHPRQKGLMYARTDVGGAYRWDDAMQQWVPITDWIGAEDANLTGIESVAVDPSDPNRVYLAAGTYTRGEAAILASDDRGRTFRQTDVPFKMGANETGRFNGERLAVDPNDGRILFFGSREDGLWRSADRGVTWQKLADFSNTGSNPNSIDGPQHRSWFHRESVGVVCVLFDPARSHPGSSTRQIYVAVSTIETNLYHSADGGNTWHAVAGQPMGLCPNHLVLSSDGLLYISYGKEPGPNFMTDGAIWKFDPRNAVWTDITPVKPKTTDQTFGYGAIAVDAEHPSTIMATTFCHWRPHDEIFRSMNGGMTWTQLWNDNTEWDHSNAPYTRSRNPHWMGVIAINPFNPDQVLFTTGYGIWSSVNATAADSGRPTRWIFLDRGLEETVPLALISPSEGVHLLSGLGDIDGFRHDDLTTSPPGTFTGPRFGNTEDLSFAWKRPQVIARTGTVSGQSFGVCAAYSLDEGKTWTAFANKPADDPSAGNIAVSADGAVFVWTPRRNPPYYTVDYGTNWIACKGLSVDFQVVADTVNPHRFYAYNSHTGKLLVSTDGAADFSMRATTLPAARGFGAGFGGDGGAGATLYATPGFEGDLWVALHTNGLYHSTDSGMNFTKVESVQKAESLGFGESAPGKDYPILYLAGCVDRLQALFRSDDTGQTWGRINNDQNQFGWINHVTGDPRIYGRVYFGTAGRGIIYGDPVADTK